ncbi:MAG: hypothetical protein RXR31_07295 [Thermoproteota archaeon]|jgi:hypothetical protein
MKKYEEYYSNLNKEVINFIEENKLEEYINFAIDTITKYLSLHRIVFDLYLDFFEDFFNRDLRILRIVVRCKNYDEYSFFYLWRSLISITKSSIPEDICSKIAIKLENES